MVHDVDAHLRRIGYDGPRDPSAPTLAALHRAHLLAVPFENLDIHLGRPIALDEAAFFDKIVRRRRGGFCYELNGLFAALLRALGFDVTLLSARVHGAGGLGPDFDHLALLVQLEERWLVDVGFGDSFTTPLRLDERAAQQQDGRAYRVGETQGRWQLDERREGSDFTPAYVFSLEPRRLDEFAEMCRFHQSSPMSHFTQRRVCSRATADGRVTIRDLGLIVTRGREKREVPLADEAALASALREHFGIVLDA